jgi:hypothetical protein
MRRFKKAKKEKLTRVQLEIDDLFMHRNGIDRLFGMFSVSPHTHGQSNTRRT